MVHKNNMCVIYDTDTRYAMKLMNVINSQKQIPFGAQIFTEEEQLTSYLSSYEPKILMLSEDVCDYKFTEDNDTQLVVLCDEELQEELVQKQYGGNTIGVYKYQPSVRILQKIIKQDTGVCRTVNTRLIGITGADVCARNILGITTAFALGEQESLLYINLDEFSGMDCIFPAEQNNTLSDTFYIYKQNGYRYSDEIRRTIGHLEYMDYIAPVQCADDISYMEADRVVQLLRIIGEELGYAYVVADISCGVRSAWHMLEGCDYIYAPEANDDWIRRKNKAMEQYFLEIGMECLVDKIVKIPIKADYNLIKDNFWSKMPLSYNTQIVREVIKKQISGDIQ